MLSRFALVWGVYWAAYLLQPAHAIYAEVYTAFLLQLAFVVSVFIGFNLVWPQGPRLNLSHQAQPAADNYVQRLILVGYAFSFIGLAMLAYDKIVIQGIDYSISIASAREQWRILGEERAGEASSIYSIFGYLLGSAYFFSLAIVCSRDILMRDGRRLLLLLVGFFLLMSNSLLTGGRSGILLLFAFVAYAYFNTHGASQLFNNRKYQSVLLGTIVAAISYTLYVFTLRAETGGDDLAEYSLEFLEYLGMGPSDWLVSFSAESRVGELLSLVNLAIAYLTHSLATVAAMLEYDGEREVVILTYYFSLLQKIGVGLSESDVWFLEGRFPSLPGGLFHQFGLLGMLIVGVVLGWVGGIFSRLHRISKHSYILLLICCGIEAVLLLSPFLFAGDFIFFPFIFFGGLASVLIVNLSFR